MIARESGEMNWFEKNLNELIHVGETEDLFFSFYLDLSEWHTIPDRIIQFASEVESGIEVEERPALFEALTMFQEAAFRAMDQKAHQGIAFFYRGGVCPFELEMPLNVPIGSWACIGKSPNIVPLVELKDVYDRYVVFISTEDQARIIEIVVGSVTKEAWVKRPELRQKVGREWTREHYQNHRKDRNRKFLKEKFEVLSRLMNQSGHNYLIIAGSPERVSLIKKELPSELTDKVIDSQRLMIHGSHDEVVHETIHSFIANEALESKANLSLLRRKLQLNRGAVIGLKSCEKALESGVVDFLFVSKNKELHQPDEFGIPNAIVQKYDAVLKKALEQKIPIEFVEEGSLLDHHQGMGALLRYDSAQFALVPDQLQEAM